MFKFGIVLSFLSFIGNVVAFPEEEGVLVLDDKNFDDAIKAHEFLLVEFYAPWCGHCKKLTPEWNAAAKALKGSSVSLAKVDATESKELGSRFGIKGFPTIKMFKSGEASDYQGGRTSADIVSFAKKQTGPSYKTLNSVADLSSFEEESDVYVVGYFSDLESAGAKGFKGLANRDDQSPYAITSNSDVKDKLGLSSDSIVLIKTSDSERVDYPVTDEFDRDAAENFIAGNRLPLINEFSPENSKKIFGSTIKKHGLFFTSKDADHHEPTVNAFRSVAAAYRGKVLMVRVPSTEAKVMEYFGLKADSLPAFVLADMSGEGQMKKFFFSGAYDSSSISSFIDDFLGNKLKQVLKSEPLSDSDTTGNVKVVKGDNFKSLVLENNNDVLVEFYAPWCGHCKKLAPTWDELGAKFASVPTVTIAKCDATANEFDVEGLNIKGFPTIYYFKGDNKKPQAYNGGRELDDLVEFLSENAATPFHLDAHSDL